MVSSFESRPTEVPTHLLNDDVRRRGLDLVLPVVLDNLDLDWARPDAPDRLGLDTIARAALLLMPALAIAEDGMRLGQGGGCYDGVLPRVPRAVPRVALVHDDEVVPRVPVEPHDLPVDAVVTPGAGLRTFASWRESTLRN
jgi:5-formyltetrahydrofolate cyclo-ligase